MKEKIGEFFQRKIVWVLLIILLLVCGCRFFVGEIIRVSGESMVPTLENGNDIFIEKFTYRNEEPERNDIVVVKTTYEGKKREYVKRIIGLPGEKVHIKKGKVYINGKPLKECKDFPKIEDGGMARNTIELGEDEYFLLGDNRNNSKDSRNVELGIVERQQILGKFWFRIYPFGMVE